MNTRPATPYGEGARGAGGKFQKPPGRKLPSTPYERPKVNQSNGKQPGGWLSKLVNPAHDLISRSATKLIPSFFYNSASISDNPVEDTTDHGNYERELMANTKIDDYHSPDPEIYRSSDEAGPSQTVEILKTNPSCPELKQFNRKKSSDDSELFKIEQIMKGNLFSRDEINRLTEILNSKVVSDVEREKQPRLSAEGEAKIKVSSALEYHMMPADVEKHVNRSVLRISSPRIESNVIDCQSQNNASPMDIAKAYMRSRTPELVPSAYSTMSKSERALYNGDDIQSHLSIPQLSAKPSTRCPGAMVQEQHGYTTPLGQKASSMLQNFPRTPYSRTVYSDSKSKSKLTQLQADNRCLKTSSSPFQHSRTPIFGQVKLRTDVDSGYGTGGAIRRIQSKFASESPGRGSVSLYSPQKGPSQVKESNASKVFFPKDKNMELIGTSGTANNQPVESVACGSKEGLPTSSPQSSPVARGILEHLANKPTPNELATELRIASAWKNSPSKNTDVMQNEVTCSTNLRGSVDLRKNTRCLKFSAEGSDDGGKLTSREKSLESDALDAITMKSLVNGDFDVTSHTSLEPSFGIIKNSDFQIKSTHEKAFMDAKRRDQDAKSWPYHKQVNVQDVMAGSELLKKQPSHFSGTKPTIKSLFVNKQGGPGFTFQVSASGILSEPPTPSIIPSFSSGGMPRATENSALPSYAFGTKRSCPRHDFSSFPSTSNSSTHDKASDIKFNFGSDRNTRVSFKLAGKDFDLL